VAEGFIGGGVGDHADGGLASHARDDTGLELLHATVVSVFVDDGQGHEIGSGGRWARRWRDAMRVGFDFF